MKAAPTLEAIHAQMGAEIIALIESGRLVMPGVPEVAQRVRRIAADPDAGIGDLAKVIEQDPTLAAHLIKVANSVAYSRGVEIRNLQMAVGRLGFRLTAMSATGFCILQMISMAGKQQARVRALYEHSLEVSERCHALAGRYRHLDRDDAMLLGLVHDIGVLPILQYARKQPALADAAELAALIEAVHAPVGAALLRAWRFPQVLTEAVEKHHDWGQGKPFDPPAYVDLLIAANLDCHRGSDHLPAELYRQHLPALARLGLKPDRPLAEQCDLQASAAQARAVCA